MLSDIQQALTNALLKLLYPLVRVLLRNGVSYGVFAELARKVFVDVAFNEFAQEGRKQTISRVAALTGLTRKEVKRLMELEQAGDASTHQRFNRAVRVISGWLNDARFHDAGGDPAPLPVEGENSFATLVREFSGDVPTQAMLSVLQAAGSVERRGHTVTLVKHAYVPAAAPLEKIGILGADTHELIDTIDHNLQAETKDLRFQRKVSYVDVSQRAASEFQTLSAEKAQALLEELNAWLAENEQLDRDAAEQGRQVSLGIYYFETDSKENDS
ncbi:MAG: DUF6502 family protein [Gammaproteobacteria bacterium]|nr:DUF6502 family protein [Gammaproteobacteria bacterium]